LRENGVISKKTVVHLTKQ